MSSPSTNPLRVWLVPFTLILVAFFLVFSVLLVFDLISQDSQQSFWLILTGTDREAASNVLGSAAEVVAAILGIAITVVAIIVELAANRYTSRVTDLFIRDRVNFCIIGLFVVATLQCLWTAASFRQDFVPIIEVRWTLILMTLSLLLLLPYFNYVFQFLAPTNIIERIRLQVMRSLKRSKVSGPAATLQHRKDLIMTAVEQVTDIALNSIAQRDRGLAMASTLILRNIVLGNFELKGDLPEDWFEVSANQRQNPDFVTLSEQGVRDLEVNHTWLEYKVFKQLSLIFSQALNNLRDVNNLVAMCFRDIAIAADGAGDEQARTLCVYFFNTILRSTANGKDVRTAYNVLHQYRQFASYLIAIDEGELVLDIFRHFQYYGLLFESRGMGFILETAAYDLHFLTRQASDSSFANEDELLSVFLEVDRDPDPGGSDRHLRGVRKAQAMLASFYIDRDKRDKARRIATDMAVEPSPRLASIKKEILDARRNFWEITDRGINFDYLKAELRPALEEFFETLLPEAREGRATRVLPPADYPG